MPRIELTDEVQLPDSDLILKIDYSSAPGSAARVFEIAAELIRALEDVDSILGKSIDSSLETALIIEDLQKSSIRVFLKNIIRHVDDDALKNLDWKPLVGSFLVKGKYAVLRWLDQDADENSVPRLQDLTEELGKLAKRTDVRHLPDYPPPNPTRLVQSLDRLQAVKRRFRDDEDLTITLGKDEYQVNLGAIWSPTDLVKDTQGPKEIVNENETFLLIHKIDLLGGTKWHFKLGKSSLIAPIEDKAWKSDYSSRKVSILPGDVLHVRLRIEQSFSERGELLETRHRIVRVLGVIPKDPPHPDWVNDSLEY